MPRSFALTLPFSSFFGWWGRELADLLAPPRDDARLRGKWLVVSLEGDCVRLLEENGSDLRELGNWSHPVAQHPQPHRDDDFISAIAAHWAKRRLPVCVRVSTHACLERKSTLPVAALRDLHRILALDLEHATPFRSDQVLTAHTTKRNASTPAALDVRQFVLKRDGIGRIQALLDKAGVPVSRIDCWEEDRKSSVPVNFLADPGAGIAEQRRTVRYFQSTVTATVLLLLSAAFVHISRLEDRVADLVSQNEAARRTVAAIRQEEEKIAVAERDYKVLADMMTRHTSRPLLLETLTRLIPDSDHLIELRVEGDQVSFSGLSASTAALIPTIEHSPMFVGAKLTSPVTRDRRTGRDRFSLTVQTATDPRSETDSRSATGREGAPSRKHHRFRRRD